MRLLGVGVTALQERAQQLRLGEDATPSRRLEEAVAAVRERFGEGAIRRALELPAGGEPEIDRQRRE